MRILRSISDSFSTRFLYTLIAGSCLWSIMPVCSVNAQNQPIYNQFFLNPFIYNPAYAGKDPNSMGFFNYRQQWVGIDGAPISYTFLFDTELKKNVSFGIIAQNDTRGVISTSSGQITLGYGIKFSDDQGLRFGLSAGAGTNSLDIDDGFTDAAIQNALDNNFFLLGRVGLNYYYKNYNLSFSIPDIFKRNLISTSSLSPIEIDPLENYIAMASAKIDIVPKTLSFSPNILYRGTSVGTSYVEAVGTFDIKELIWIGGSYRQNYGITGLLGIKVKNYITIGYGYEIPTAKLAGLSNSTHEVQLSIRMGKDKVKEAEEKAARIAAKREKQKLAREAYAKKVADEKAAKAAAAQKELEAKKRAEALEAQKIIDAENRAKAIKEQSEREEHQRVQELEKQRASDAEKAKEEARRIREEREKQLADKEEKKSPVIVETKPIEPVEETPIVVEELKVEEVEPIVETKPDPVVEQKTVVVTKGDDQDELDEDHYVIVGSFNNKEHALKMVNQLKSQGYNTGYGYSTARSRYYVHLHKSSSASEARNERDKYRKMSQFKDAWHLEVQSDDIKELGKAKVAPVEKTPNVTTTESTKAIDTQKPVTIKKGNHMLELDNGHYVVVGAFSNFDNAEKYSDQVFKMGYQNSFGYASAKKLYYIYIHKGESDNDARTRRDQIRKVKSFSKAWYLLVED